MIGLVPANKSYVMPDGLGVNRGDKTGNVGNIFREAKLLKNQSRPATKAGSLCLIIRQLPVFSQIFIHNEIQGIHLTN